MAIVCVRNAMLLFTYMCEMMCCKFSEQIVCEISDDGVGTMLLLVSMLFWSVG